MKRLAIIATLIVAAGTAIAMAPLPAAAERTQSDFVFVREGETITEDLYAAGNLVVIAGVIDGDLIATAFTEVRIEGEVRGSVTALASSVVIDGAVGGSVRAIAGSVDINGSVGGDVFTAAPTVRFGPQAHVERDGLIWANQVDVMGRVDRNLEGQSRSATIGAKVGGDVDITVSRLTVLATASIDGDLVYVGDDHATVAPDADIGGSVIAETNLPANVRIRALVLLVRILVSLAIVALGLSLIWSFPDRSQRAAMDVSERPIQAALWGIGLASIPIALSPPATGLPLLLVFAPIVLGGFTLLAVGLLAAPVPVAAAIGRRIGPARSTYAWFVIGAGILVVLTLVPLIGPIMLGLSALVGLGGWFVERRPEAGRQLQAADPDDVSIS